MPHLFIFTARQGCWRGRTAQESLWARGVSILAICAEGHWNLFYSVISVMAMRFCYQPRGDFQKEHLKMEINKSNEDAEILWVIIGQHQYFQDLTWKKPQTNKIWIWFELCECVARKIKTLPQLKCRQGMQKGQKRAERKTVKMKTYSWITKCRTWRLNLRLK